MTSYSLRQLARSPAHSDDCKGLHFSRLSIIIAVRSVFLLHVNAQ